VRLSSSPGVHLMPTKCSEANRRYCKARYQRIRANPERYAALLASHRAYKRSKPKGTTCESVTEHSPVVGAFTGRAVNPPVNPESEVTAPVNQPVNPLACLFWGNDPNGYSDGIEERAAIMEFDGGLTREQADEAAQESLMRAVFGEE